MMKVKLLAGAISILLLLTFIHPCIANTGRETVVVFQDGKTDVQYTADNSQTTTQKPSAFNAPSFVCGMINNREFLAFISSARLEDSSEGDYTDGVVKTRYGNNKKWTDAEIFYKVSEVGDSHAPWGDTTAVMKGNKIYVLVTSMGDANSGDTLRDPLMIVGTVMNRTDSNIDDVCIKWDAKNKIKDKLSNTVKWTEASKFMGGEGNGIVTTNGTIIFPIVIIKNNDKYASTLYSIDDGTTWAIGGETEITTSDGSLVEWSKEKLLFVAAAEDGFRKVFESNDLGITWKRSPIFFAVWGNNENHQGPESPGSVITVPVDAENVFIFAYPLNKNNKNNFDTLQLWLSDGQRITFVGTISDESKEENTGNSVLAYVEENFYITHQINPSGLSNGNTDQTKDEWNKVIGLTSLPDFFANVKTTVRAWRTLDDDYERKGIPTDSLVGVLGSSRTNDDKVWTDMYNCVNATVNGGKNVDGGFQFNGAVSSGAKWPVIIQGQNQVYKFTEKQFTFAATVIIHSTIETEDVSLLGASGDADGNQVLIGLGYTKDRTWYSIQKADKKINTDIPVVLEKEYHVAITLENKAVSVYVGDKEIISGKITFQEALSISHFFMGGTGVSVAAENDNLCTVKNVMLFSRALQKSEIEKLTKAQENTEMKEETTKANKGHVLETPADNSRVPPSRNTEGHVLTPNTRPTIEQGNKNTISATGSTSTTENIKSMSTKEPKEASVITTNKTTNEKDQNKKINNALHGSDDAVLKKDTKGDNGAALSLSALAWMRFVCSIIALMGF